MRRPRDGAGVGGGGAVCSSQSAMTITEGCSLLIASNESLSPVMLCVIYANESLFVLICLICVNVLGLLNVWGIYAIPT